MKKMKSLTILCTALLFCAMLVLPAFAQMTKVNEEELSQLNASITGTPSQEMIASGDGTIDKTGQVLSSPANRPSTNPGNIMGVHYNLNTNQESVYYHHPWANNGTNQWYWGGGSTSDWNRTYLSR